MDDAFHAAMAGWSNFYVIVGSGAAALTGLMFVAITLIADGEHASSGRQVSAFGTPTIVQFVAPLVLSAALSAPWKHASSVAWVIGALGAAGVVYSAIVIRVAQMQREYRPVLSDWIWFSIAPLVAYASLVVVAWLLRTLVEDALFGVAAASTTLLLIAIRNAWDTVTFVAVARNKRRRQRKTSEGADDKA